MTSMTSYFHRLHRIGMLFVLLLLMAFVPTALAQTTPAKSSSKLSPRLDLLSQPVSATRSVVQLASQLSLPATGAGSLQRTATGEVLVSVHVNDTSEAIQHALVAAGGRIRHVSSLYRIIDAYIAPSALPTVANVAGVDYLEEAVQPMVRGASQSASTSRQAAPAATCPTGIVSEGVAQLRADAARSQFGLDGAGVKIGIVSDSFATTDYATSAEQDIASGDLPGLVNPCGNTTPVAIIAESTDGGIDEGRAMAQIVHDLAPKAALSFATAGGSMYEMADNIRKLGNDKANLVVDDIVFYGEPLFQDGPINVAIRENAAKGISHFTAAGNANELDGAGNNISSYEAAAYRPTTCPKLAGLAANQRPRDCHNFALSGTADPTSGFTLSTNGSLVVEFQWAEPWFGVTTDLDIFLVSDATGAVVAGSISPNIDRGSTTGSDRPFELFSYSSSRPVANVSMVIGRYAGTGTPRLKYVLQSARGVTATEYNASNNTTDIFGPSVGDHVATQEAIGVAAVPYNSAQTPEPFSSLGPQVHYFGPINYPLQEKPDNELPAAALATPEILNKPDIAATDGGQNTFFGQQEGSVWRFFGTSAAAPHAAGVAALVIQRANQRGLGTSPALIESIFESSASAVANGSSASVGAGLVNAVAALSLVNNIEPRAYIPLANR